MTRALCLLLCAACAPALRSARRSAGEPPSESELEAEAAVADRSCRTLVTALLPGLRQACQGRTIEGALLLGVGTAELATGIAVASKHSIEYPGAAVPLLAYSDLVLFHAFDGANEALRARRVPLVPQDTLGELLAAPWNPKVLGSVDVWAGILGTVAAGLAASAALEGFGSRFGDRPRLFGRDQAPGVGYPLAAGIGAGLFAHVAIAEETVFRGYFQSALARRFGEQQGWLYGSAIFGLAHAPNALFVESGQRLRYLALGVPFITVLGGYLGLSYRWHGYGLAAPVAIHFWYDFLISAVAFAADPQRSPLAARIALPW